MQLGRRKTPQTDKVHDAQAQVDSVMDAISAAKAKIVVPTKKAMKASKPVKAMKTLKATKAMKTHKFKKAMKRSGK